MQSSFVLEQTATFAHLGRTTTENRWTEFVQKSQRELGLLLLPGEILQLPPLEVPPEPVIWVRCVRTPPDAGDARLEITLKGVDGMGAESLPIVTLPLAGLHAGCGARELLLDFPLAPGCISQLEVRCEWRGAGLLRNGQIGLVGLIVCNRHELPLWRARSHRAWRLENEIAHFQNVYSGEFYKDRHVDRGAQETSIGSIRELPPRPNTDDALSNLRDLLLVKLRQIESMPNENAFSYATRLLGNVIPDRAPNYPERLKALAQEAPTRSLRMLALCAGEAAVEGQILAAANVSVELCIVDLNASLLERSSLQIPRGVTLDRLLGDANDIGPQLGLFDVVCITSGLHHLVELEHVLSTIATLLEAKGEFWLIGEQVGRNGNRLWPEALARANEIFSHWPAGKRLNCHTKGTDELVPDTDFSAGCFEGIRSEEILALLGRYFLPVVCYLRNAFLWRLVDATYSANFNLEQPADRELIVQAVADEAVLWATGGRSTEMHAVYRSKWAGLAATLDV